MRSLRLRPGQRVPVTIGSRSRPMRVVGVAVFPLFSQATSAATDLGTGAAVAASVLSEPDPPLCAGDLTCYNFVLIRFKPGASRRSAVAGLAAAVARAGCPRGICLITADQRPGEIRNVAGARDTPLVLGLVLAFLAVASLSHVLVTGARRRRRDLAVLKTLGLGGSQVMATVLWQSAAITAAALVIGLPAGLLAGRWTWSLLAGNLGVAARRQRSRAADPGLHPRGPAARVWPGRAPGAKRGQAEARRGPARGVTAFLTPPAARRPRGRSLPSSPARRRPRWRAAPRRGRPAGSGSPG